MQYVRFPLDDAARARRRRRARRWRSSSTIRTIARGARCRRPCAAALVADLRDAGGRRRRAATGARWLTERASRPPHDPAARGRARGGARVGHRAPDGRAHLRSRAARPAVDQPRHGLPQPPAAGARGPDRRRRSSEGARRCTTIPRPRRTITSSAARAGGSRTSPRRSRPSACARGAPRGPRGDVAHARALRPLPELSRESA